MAETVEELTVNWEDNGQLKVRELDKEILSRGAWATIMFLFQELDAKTQTYRPPKIGVRRYRKRSGSYIFQSKFNISSEKQAKEMVDVIQRWFAEDGIGKNIPPVEEGAASVAPQEEQPPPPEEPASDGVEASDDVATA